MQGDHASKQYDLELDTIRAKVLQMGGVVENQLYDAISCLRRSHAEKAKQVIQGDAAVNRLEKQLDGDCIHLLVRRQPAANDLRAVLATLKIVTDLERIGDEAAKVARSASHLHERGKFGALDPYEAVRVLAAAAAGALHEALDAFVRLDAALATRVIVGDARIDHEYGSTVRNMITFMLEDPRTISAALDCLWVAKAMERIGDHAKNIAEYVVYIVDGDDIRHRGYAEAARGNGAAS